MHVSNLRTVVLAALAALVSLRDARAGGVVVVGDPTGTSYPTIQSAIDASSDGAVLLVGPGSYSGFSITNKSVSVFAPQGGVYLPSTLSVGVVIDQVAASRSVVLSGLSIGGFPAVRVNNCVGAVRVDHCTLYGTYEDGSPALSVTNSSAVAIDSSSLQGDIGWNTSMCCAGAGGNGLSITNSKVAVYRSVVKGGRGGSSPFDCGAGGHGIYLDGGELLVAASQVTGDSNGSGGAGGCSSGNGLRVQSGLARALDSTFTGAGVPDTFGPVTFLPGVARRFSAPTVLIGGASFSLDVEGALGDSVWLALASRPGFKLAPTGYWLVKYPTQITFAPLGMIQVGSTASFNLTAPNLSGVAARQMFEQGLVYDYFGGAQWLANPLQPIVLERNALPDCNGNGVSDIVEVLEGTALDCDESLLPDACEIASGQKPDCNSNGVPDACDIQSGFSQDKNANGKPDECEYSGQLLYVDAAAPAGGDGSPGAPFNVIQDALDYASSSGNTVVVLAGTYVGPRNRNLDAHGKQVVVQGASGSANCVIDCQDLGRAFNVTSGEPSSMRIEELTIEHATAGFWVRDASPTIAGCVVRYSEEGVHVSDTSSPAPTAPRIVDCRFEDNDASATSIYFGGAGVHADGSASVVVSGCVFTRNVGMVGGAIEARSVSSPGSILVSHCVFLDNHATHPSGNEGGGAVRLGSRGSVVDCLFAGNTAVRVGGALYLDSSDPSFSAGAPTVIGCTFSGNSAGVTGGAIAIRNSQTTRIANCIAWGDSAPSGGELALLTSNSNPAAVSVDVRYCDIAGGQAGVPVLFGTLIWGAGNLAVDPKFVDPDGPDNDPATFGDNVYRLLTSSPCLDAGDNTSVPLDFADFDGDGITNEPDPLDLNLKPRFKDLPYAPDVGNGTPPLVDLGCYERQS